MSARIVKILMRRDDLTQIEAEAEVLNCKECIKEAVAEEASMNEIEDIIRCELGLEPDYLFDLLPFTYLA